MSLDTYLTTAIILAWGLMGFGAVMVPVGLVQAVRAIWRWRQ